MGFKACEKINGTGVEAVGPAAKREPSPEGLDDGR
jgi:hypothetical protein